MLKNLMLYTFTALVLCSFAYAAMEPSPFYCDAQGYLAKDYYEASINGSLFIAWREWNPAALQLNYEGQEVNLTGSEVTKPVLIGDMRIDNPWNLPFNKYCFFGDGEKCLTRDFLYGSCGGMYKKDLPCKKIGENVWSFETCCEGKPFARPFFDGSPTCENLPNRVFETVKYDLRVRILIILILVGPVSVMLYKSIKRKKNNSK